MSNNIKIKQWDSYTDEDNVNFVKGEYGDYKVGKVYYVGTDNTSEPVGYVQEKYGFDEKGNNDTSCKGMQAYIVTPENNRDSKDVKQVAVVYQGSNADWFDNDLKIGA